MSVYYKGREKKPDWGGYIIQVFGQISHLLIDIYLLDAFILKVKFFYVNRSIGIEIANLS
ncbi:hypothetical protein BKI52_19275 [marine bacterium AO1-C]|nr:hypothetical protein BKI52_19275 [marine bacterium AO1-C]